MHLLTIVRRRVTKAPKPRFFEFSINMRQSFSSRKRRALNDALQRTVLVKAHASICLRNAQAHAQIPRQHHRFRCGKTRISIPP